MSLVPRKSRTQPQKVGKVGPRAPPGRGRMGRTGTHATMPNHATCGAGASGSKQYIPQASPHVMDTTFTALHATLQHNPIQGPHRPHTVRQLCCSRCQLVNTVAMRRPRLICRSDGRAHLITAPGAMRIRPHRGELSIDGFTYTHHTLSTRYSGSRVY